MRGWLAENKGWRAMTAEVGIALALIATTMTLSMRALAQGQGPALTTISDTVYRADGTAAAGTVLISWPSFQTAQGQAVTAGNLAVTIGAQERLRRNWFRMWERRQRGLTMLRFFSWMTERCGRNIGRFQRLRRPRLRGW